jgi:mannose-1-phosphate guanylyltransferase
MSDTNTPAAPETFAIVLCGGSGSRLWPRSRSSHPKHLLELEDGGRTLVQETIKRIDLPFDRIYCVTEASHSELLKQQLPELPHQNVVVEPDRRGTASAIGLALAQMRERLDDDSVVISLHADALIREEALFRETVQAWVAAASQTKRIINLGIRPTYPSTGFGYINLGQKIDSVGEYDVFETLAFVEKPNQATATTYVDSGRYLWNSGMFAGRGDVLLPEMERHLPNLMKTVGEMAGMTDPEDRKKLYLTLESETIDEGLLEKSDQLAVIPATFSWADVGSWADLHDVLERDKDGNLFDGEYIDIDSHDCFVYSPKQLVATIGLSNLVIINTGDAVLICPKDRSQDVKKVVERLKAEGMERYL